MLCSEGAQVQSEPAPKPEEKSHPKKEKKVPSEGTGSLYLNSFKSPKTWKKSISNFFRQQLRSTRSNDGDRSNGSKENFETQDISPEQKWQSLGKMFKRQSMIEHRSRAGNQLGESSSQTKRPTVKKVISSYFCKNQKSSEEAQEK